MKKTWNFKIFMEIIEISKNMETLKHNTSLPHNLLKTIGNTIHFANFATVYLMGKKCKKCTQTIMN